MSSKVLLTGSEGLIGKALGVVLEAEGFEVVPFDLRRADRTQDICNESTVCAATQGCRGIVHLAAVSRVVWGEQDPELCVRTNVGGTKNVLNAAMAAKTRPWLLFASSREVYGDVSSPVTENASLQALNVYGRAKIDGEKLVAASQLEGLGAGIARLSNVYGGIEDHKDRVIPAFAHAALRGSELRVDGPNHTFDFTHIEDVTDGLIRMVRQLHTRKESLPTMHFTTGIATSLSALASWALELSNGRCTIREAPERDYDVSHFVGDASRANELLDWRARIGPKRGFKRFVEDLAVQKKG